MFTHLHTHSYYSFLRGLASPAELAQAAVQNGMQSLALTDYRLLTGALEFYAACKSSGIQPILGLVMEVIPPNGIVHKLSTLTRRQEHKAGQMG